MGDDWNDCVRVLQRSRGAATSVAVLVNWLANLVVGLVFPTLQVWSLMQTHFLVIYSLVFINQDTVNHKKIV